MFVDVVFPNGNEKEFIELAPRLGYGGLCFVYPYDRNVYKYEEKIKKLQRNSKLKLYYGFIV